MAAPEDTRDALISGAISAGLHAALLLLLIGAAVLAPPELIERVIPVALMRETPAPLLPGSNEAPAPAAPKAVGAMRPNAAALAAAQALTPAQAQALREAALAAAQREIERLELADTAPQPVALPTQLDRREARADRIAARAATAAVAQTPVDVRSFSPTRIDPADLAAVPVDVEGPRQVDTRNLADLAGPQSSASLAALDPGDYAAAVDPSSLAAPSSGLAGLEAGRAYGVDTGADTSGLGADYGRGAGAGEGYGAGRGTGGTGTAVGVVSCLESRYVLDYLDMIRERTNARWRVPKGVAPNTEVVLRFDLDAAGMASGVSAEDAAPPVLSESATQALMQAAPFPPMDDNNRCLAEKRIVLTFAVPSR